MLLSTALLTFAASVALAQKLDPPGGLPAFRIYLDLDDVVESGNSSACAIVKSQRRLCYSRGVASGKYIDEQSCLCDPDTAEAASQCFAYTYSGLKNTTEKALYYQSFLYYLYDCYCGVTTTDVSLNVTTGAPYIQGLNGTLILPPDQACPTAPSDCVSKPPCSCKPTRPPTKWKWCEDGYDSVCGKCVQKPPVPPPCDPPRKIIGNQCVCAKPNVQDKAGNCLPPPCPPGQVPGCKGCVCPDGQEFGATPDTCVPICPYGTRRTTPGGPCDPYFCPRDPPWETTCGGQCICPSPYVQTPAGDCVEPPAPCVAPFITDPWNPQECICPCPYELNDIGQCLVPPPPIANCTAPFEQNPYQPWSCWCPPPNAYNPDTGSCGVPPCPPPSQYSDYSSECICPFPYVLSPEGVCETVSCTFPQTYDVYNGGCQCSYPWDQGTDGSCTCPAPNALDANGECVPPPLYYNATDIPTIEALPPPNDTIVPPEVTVTLDPATVTPSASESFAPSGESSPAESIPVVTDFSSAPVEPTDVPSGTVTDVYPTDTPVSDTPVTDQPTATEEQPPVDSPTDAPAPPETTPEFAPPSA